MLALGRLVTWEAFLFLFACYGLVLLGFLTKQINTRWLMFGRTGNDAHYFSPERVQLLIFTIGAAFYYLSQVVANRQVLPSIPDAWLAVIGGSNAVYLAGKISARCWSRNG